MNVNVGGTKCWTKISLEARKGWSILDIEPPKDNTPHVLCDLNQMKPFPFKPNSVDHYYCSHTLEHLIPPAVPHVLSEMYRTLKPNGLLRVVVPDVRLAIERYLAGDIRWLKDKNNPSADRDNYPDTPLGLLLPWFYSTGTIEHTGKLGHRMAFDERTLQVYLANAGFTSVALRYFGACSTVFNGLDLVRHKGRSLFVECKK